VPVRFRLSAPGNSRGRSKVSAHISKALVCSRAFSFSASDKIYFLPLAGKAAVGIVIGVNRARKDRCQEGRSKNAVRASCRPAPKFTNVPDWFNGKSKWSKALGNG
jgi:uncharacterized secreted protein with C-terminal beta-propeller domain